MRLDCQQILDSNGAWSANPRQIVAHQVDDHDVLGRVLGGSAQCRCTTVVCSSGCGALDRRRQHGAVPNPQEELGAETRDHLPVSATPRASDQAAKGGLQLIAQLPEYRRCGAAHLSMQADTEVQLVEAAVIDSADHVLNSSEVTILCIPAIRRDAEGSDLHRLDPRVWRSSQYVAPVIQSCQIVMFPPSEPQGLKAPPALWQPTQRRVIERQSRRAGVVSQAGKPSATDKAGSQLG